MLRALWGDRDSPQEFWIWAAAEGYLDIAEVLECLIKIECSTGPGQFTLDMFRQVLHETYGIPLNTLASHIVLGFLENQPGVSHRSSHTGDYSTWHWAGMDHSGYRA